MKQKTIGINPLEEYLSQKGAKEAAIENNPEQDVRPIAPLKETVPVDGQMIIGGTEPRPAQGSKLRITLHISADIVDRVKNAVYWEPGLTVAGFAEEALANALDQIETERGAPFPQRRQHKLRGGRPII